MYAMRFLYKRRNNCLQLSPGIRPTPPPLFYPRGERWGRGKRLMIYASRRDSMRNARTNCIRHASVGSAQWPYLEWVRTYLRSDVTAAPRGASHSRWIGRHARTGPDSPLLPPVGGRASPGPLSGSGHGRSACLWRGNECDRHRIPVLSAG